MSVEDGDVNQEAVFDVRVEDWGPTPAKAVLVIRTHLGLRPQVLGLWLKSAPVVVARGSRQSLSVLLDDLWAAGTRCRLVFVEENTEEER